MLPFDLLAHEEQSTVDRALGVEPKWNAWVDLHNLIVSAETTHDYGVRDTKRIGREHGVDFGTAFYGERVGLYASYLDHCLDHNDLTDRNRAELAHLARTLSLSVHDLQPFHERAFGRAVSGVLSDDCVTLEERLLLYKLQHVLGVDPGEAELEYEEQARQKLLLVIAKALCDGQLSPEEQANIRQVRENLEIELPKQIRDMLSEAASAWHILQGDLPDIPVRAQLLQDEVAHLSVEGEWQAINYAVLRVALSDYRAALSKGETEQLKIPKVAMKGRRAGGRIIVTNKRLILIQSRKEVAAFTLAKLSDIEQFSNGLRVAVRGKHSILLDTGRRNDVLLAVINRARRTSA
ncbi:MAG: hypothetical protein R3284_08400 [Rubricoccaceae bacterium]|nr:hypothetical protein [Rubricoccaceae bacterium]